MSGILEEMKSELLKPRFKEESASIDSMFRKAITSHAVLSMGFDLRSGARVCSDLDIMPAWLPNDVNLRNLVFILFAQAAHHEVQLKLESLFENSYTKSSEMIESHFFSDCMLRDLTRQTHTYRSYRIYHSFAEKEPNQSAFFYLVIADIQEIQAKEQQKEHALLFDSVTEMLNRSAFERKLIQWLDESKKGNETTFSCFVIIMIGNPLEIYQASGREYFLEQISQLSVTLKTLAHPNELCCRYGIGEFAIILAEKEKETLLERIKLLQMVCNARRSDYPDVNVYMGYRVELVWQIEFADLLLDQIHRSLLFSVLQADSERQHAELPKGYTVVAKDKQDRNGLMNPHKDASSNQRIFIRTFGHFDVFVDGEAVLFNHPKAKELLALLVDRRGGFVSANEAISCLWEEEPSNNTTLARCRKAAMHMRQSLSNYGIEWIVETINGKRRVLISRCDCDLEHYLRQDNKAANKMIGNYMSEYSWAENSMSMD